MSIFGVTEGGGEVWDEVQERVPGGAGGQVLGQTKTKVIETKSY